MSVSVVGGCTLLGRGIRIDRGIARVLMANVGVWLTTKEIGWIMFELCGYSANGKSICRRIMGLEYKGLESLGDGRVECIRLSKPESQWLKCKYKYRWVKNDE